MNISRTDSRNAALRAEVARIDADADAGLDPYPIAAREQRRRARLTDIIRRHDAQRRIRGATMNTSAVAAPGPRDGAALARLVGEALAHAQGHDGTEDASEIRAITDAMVRLLIGAPLRSDGKLTIVSLAAEAGLRRNTLAPTAAIAQQCADCYRSEWSRARTPPQLVVRRFAHEDLPQIRQTMTDIHAYGDASDDQFNQRFPWFVDHWGWQPWFRLRHRPFYGQQPVAFAY
ncbi:hypothetical protein [Streptomyces sp. NPDC048256]|uniref:hypothetical protein n=1 Tax=Streptomyces sp. NPDC048256 TaxID=3154613 RepID=UPI0033FCE2F8